MRKVAQIMGLPITIDIPSCEQESFFEKAFARLRQIDERFSTYKPASEVSRFTRGEIDEDQLSAELKLIIKECKKAKKETDGYFSAWASAPKQFDPSGYVKGWAIAQAGKLIEKAGFKTYCISAGGDILARSKREKVWSIGIQDPSDNNKILNKLSISNGAVATSGNYERGEHILNPKTGKPANYWVSVSIIGPDIILADVLATACFAMGKVAAEFMTKYTDYQFLGIKSSRESNL